MPPALAIPCEAFAPPLMVVDENPLRLEQRKEHSDPPDNTMRTATSNMPSRISSRSNKSETTNVFEDDNAVSSPETPEHHKSILNSDDLAFADFSSLDAYFDQQSLEASSVDDSKSSKVIFRQQPLSKQQPERFCIPNANLFRRKKKVSSVDVASVGNASDTMVSLSSRTQISGRELHERAKEYFNDGDYKRACPLFEAILSAQVRRFSPLHPSVGAAMHNVGVCRLRLGQYSLAENLFSEAVLIRQKVLGYDHLEVASSLSKLGSTRLALRKFDEAQEDLQKALQVAENLLGHNHKVVAQMLGHLGCFYFEAGELYAAQANFEEALRIYRHVWPREKDRDAITAMLTDTLCNIGSILNRRKRYVKAIEAFSEALDFQRGIYGHDDARVIATLDNLGYSYSKLKNHASALQCYRKMLRAQVSSNGTFTDEAFQSLRKQLLMYEKLGRISDAVDETKEIIQLQKSMLPLEHVLIAKTKQLLANLSNKLQEAKAYS